MSQQIARKNNKDKIHTTHHRLINFFRFYNPGREIEYSAIFSRYYVTSKSTHKSNVNSNLTELFHMENLLIPRIIYSIDIPLLNLTTQKDIDHYYFT